MTLAGTASTDRHSRKTAKCDEVVSGTAGVEYFFTRKTYRGRPLLLLVSPCSDLSNLHFPANSRSKRDQFVAVRSEKQGPTECQWSSNENSQTLFCPKYQHKGVKGVVPLSYIADNKKGLVLLSTANFAKGVSSPIAELKGVPIRVRKLRTFWPVVVFGMNTHPNVKIS